MLPLKHGAMFQLQTHYLIFFKGRTEKPLQYCKVISLQLIKINEKKKKKKKKERKAGLSAKE